MSNVTVKSVGPWQMQVSDHVLHLSELEHRFLKALARDWRDVFLSEPNYMEDSYRTPSIVIRVDYALSQTNVECPYEGIHVYEVEERPAGIGVCSHLNSEAYHSIAKAFESVSAGILVSNKREALGTDDFYQDRIPVWREGEESKAKRVYFRVHRDESKFFGFNSISVSTIKNEGCKAYGVELNLWKRIPTESERTDLWWSHLKQSSFAVKFAQGSRFDGVKIWTKDRLRGSETWGKIQSVINSGQGSYIQAYMPHEIGHDFVPTNHTLFRRCYLVYNINTDEYEVVGGVYMSVPDVRGHGTRDAVTGKLSLG